MKTLLLSFLLLCLFSCTNDKQEINTNNNNNNIDIIEVNTNKNNVEVKNESRYHYDQDWEIFKTAVLNNDIKGVASFASSDNIDSEALLQTLSEDYILKKLKSTSYDDLKSETQGDFTFLVFSAEISGSDGEGNEYESGVYLYFTQGETTLLLEYYLAAE